MYNKTKVKRAQQYIGTFYRRKPARFIILIYNSVSSEYIYIYIYIHVIISISNWCFYSILHYLYLCTDYKDYIGKGRLWNITASVRINGYIIYFR